MEYWTNKSWSFKRKISKVTPIHLKITPEWIDNFDFSSYDYILDAIDDVKPKVHLIKKHFTKLLVQVVEKKIDPSKIEYISIWDTYNDPFIKNRTELKTQGFQEKI